ncbi:MAG TPA: hypothetical protein DEF36_15285 [Desulfotomaculum sp.]|nr:hypothetical protein [Desulfotomaculum sp.]
MTGSLNVTTMLPLMEMPVPPGVTPVTVVPSIS